MNSSNSQSESNTETLALDLHRMMVRVRQFEAKSIVLKREGRVLANTYPSLGQEAIGAAAMALDARDVVFPSYRSRPAFFGKGVTALDHFKEMLAAPDSLLSGREVFHHASWPAKGVMPTSSMIGAWLPMAAGYALSQKLDGDEGITACFMGDGSFGAGDFHETLNMVGLWRVPFLMVCENNAWQVSQPWSAMRLHRAMSVYFEHYGFRCLEVDGNDATAVHQATLEARRLVGSGSPTLLDCFTYRMGSYSSHFPEPRAGIEGELREWTDKDPIERSRRACIGRGVPAAALDVIEAEVALEIDAAFAQASAATPPVSRRQPASQRVSE